MAVVIETSVWELNPSLFIFLFLCCLLSIFLFPYSARNTSPSPFQHGTGPSFLRFRRNFLLMYSLASVMEGLWSVLGEFGLAYYGASREQMVSSLSVGVAAAFSVGTLLGVLSDAIGQRKFCLLFCILHLLVGVWKRMTAHPNIWLASICLSVASSIFSFSFETWMVLEHEKQGHRQELLSDTFWLMTFFESASLIGSQMLSNWLVGGEGRMSMGAAFTAAIWLAAIAITCLTWGWKEPPQTAEVEDHKLSYASMLYDKRIWLLAFAQGSLHLSIAVFWILWAPTLVADGREIHLGLVYPCLLGARMLGSTIFPWLINGSAFRTEDCLLYAFIVSGFALFVLAYDYQEIGVLVSLFCLFHTCVGIILPSLARLRTMYIPNELRAGMISLSLAPANATLLLLLLQGGYYKSISNATIMAVAAVGLFAAGVCMHALKRLGKQPYLNWHKS